MKKGETGWNRLKQFETGRWKKEKQVETGWNSLAKKLTDEGVNVEIQSISKQEKNIVVVFKLSDFNLNKLNAVEAFLDSKKINKREIQFFSSSEWNIQKNQSDLFQSL